MLACVVPLALAGAALFPAAASAYSRGFTFTNLSGHALKLVRVQTVNGVPPESAPAVGTVLPPAAQQGFQLTFEFGALEEVEADYVDQTDGSGVFFRMTVYQVTGVPRAECGVSLGSEHTCSTDGVNSATYLDPPGTVHEIPPGQGQAQHDVLQQLCTDDNGPAACKFAATGQAQVYSPSHPVGNALINNTGVDQDTTVKISDAVGSTDSVQVSLSVEAKLGKIFKVAFSTTYGHEWTSEHTFEQDVDVHCPAHNKCSIAAVSPLLRTTGDFTLMLGNTTWHLRGVYVDSPDPNGSGAYTVNAQPLTAHERATLPRSFSVQRLVRGIYTVPPTAARGAIARPKLRLAILGSRSLVAGQSAVYRIIVASTAPPDRVSFSLLDVRVAARVAGHRAGGWLLSRLPGGRSRTLRLRLIVPRLARGDLCITVQAAARHARGARARLCARVTGYPSPSGLG